VAERSVGETMTTPHVNELPRSLEPVVPDPFLGDPQPIHEPRVDPLADAADDDRRSRTA
jgi:hypothetical protein